jgi:hypothetical protein
MKVTNTTYGIDSVPKEEAKRTWYRWHRFPLLPIFDKQEGDEWNTPGFSFSWLNLRCWSMDSPDLGFNLAIESIGAYIQLRLPYLNIYFWLLGFPESWHFKFWRKPKGSSF